MKYILSNIEVLFLFMLPFLFRAVEAGTTVDLKISSAEYKHEYLQSLKFVQKMILNPLLSSFLEDKEISLHQQVLAQKRLATYYGELQVGAPDQRGRGQTFKMLFDTGSCEFWLPSNKCFNERCGSHVRYYPTSSQKAYHEKMEIHYLSGHVSGQMVKETINIGGLTVKDQVIGLADQIEIPGMNEVIWDGILGGAYPNRNGRNKGISPGIDSIITQDGLHKKGEKNQFAYYLGLNNGAITFGGADMKYKRDGNEEFKWAPISERNYWTVTGLDIKKYPKVNKANIFGNNHNEMEGVNVLCPYGCKSIVDTGTYLIYGPSEQIKTFGIDLKIDSCQDKSRLPNGGFVFKGYSVNGKDTAFELQGTPDDYVLEFDLDGGGRDCVVGFGSDSDDAGWTLGQVFLKAYYTVFDRESESVGFVKSNPEPGGMVEKEGIGENGDRNDIGKMPLNGPINEGTEHKGGAGIGLFTSFLKISDAGD